MLDTPNSHLEIERRELALGILWRGLAGEKILGLGLGRREDFAVVILCRFDSAWPPFGVGRVRLELVWTCNLHDRVARFGSFRILLGIAFSKYVNFHCSGYIFRSQSVCRIRRFVLTRGASQMCNGVACRRFRNAASDFQAERFV